MFGCLGNDLWFLSAPADESFRWIIIFSISSVDVLTSQSERLYGDSSWEESARSVAGNFGPLETKYSLNAEAIL